MSNIPETGSPVPLKPKRDPIIYLICGVVGCVGFLTAKTAYTFINSYFSAQFRQGKTLEKNIRLPAPLPLSPQAQGKETKKAVLQTAPATPPATPDASGFVLSGVFFSDNEGFALINNHIVKEGDFIEGAIIQRITIDEVVLISNGQAIKIYTYSK
ncbi:MAG: hypothetical protein WDL87_05235 [Candidatus Omnitrophota bacterium]|jgi:hypothetical protein